MAMGTSGTPEHEATAREQLMKQWPGQDWEVREDAPRTPKGKGKPSGNSNGDDERRDDS